MESIKTKYAFGASGDVYGGYEIHYYAGMQSPKFNESVKDYYSRYPRQVKSFYEATDDEAMLFDCSGLVQWYLEKTGVEYDDRLTVASISRIFDEVSTGELEPGDILIQGNYHAGIYVGDGFVVEAAYPWLDAKQYGMYDGVQCCKIISIKDDYISTLGDDAVSTRKWTKVVRCNDDAYDWEGNEIVVYEDEDTILIKKLNLKKILLNLCCNAPEKSEKINDISEW